MSVALVTVEGRRCGPSPERRRPAPRKRGWLGAVEAMDAEDAIVRELASADCRVSLQQAAAAVELATRCAGFSHGALCHDTIACRYRSPAYLLRLEDFRWLDQAAALVDARPDPDVMSRLGAIVDAIPHDAAAVASLNAARWIIWAYQRGLH
jgi:hypothetical protein